MENSWKGCRQSKKAHDVECFEREVTAALHREKVPKNPYRLSSLDQYVSWYN